MATLRNFLASIPGTRLAFTAPRQKFHRRDDREQPDHHKEREFCQEGVAVKILIRALFKKEHPQQPHDQQCARRDAVRHIRNQKPRAEESVSSCRISAN